MNDLKLFFVMFAVHGENQWAAHAGYIFAKQEEHITYLLGAQYGDVNVRYIKPVDIVEGKVFYGERWNEL